VRGGDPSPDALVYETLMCGFPGAYASEQGSAMRHIAHNQGSCLAPGRGAQHSGATPAPHCAAHNAAQVSGGANLAAASHG